MRTRRSLQPHVLVVPELACSRGPWSGIVADDQSGLGLRSHFVGEHHPRTHRGRSLTGGDPVLLRRLKQEAVEVHLDGMMIQQQRTSSNAEKPVVVAAQSQSQ